MPRLSIRTPAVSLAVVASALAFTACSDSPVSPTSSLRSSAANFSVSGTNPLTIVSDGSTLYCPSGQLNGGNNAVGDWTIPATFAAIDPATCTTALDLQLPAGTSPLDVYNPGWSAPFAGSHWIGIETKGGPSSDYRPNPGRYVFQETFSVPSGVTNATLDLHVRSDNVAAVYLNGNQIGAQANTDCNTGPCNWDSDLHLTPSLTAGTNYTLTFVVSDVPTGFPDLTPFPAGFGGPAPQYACPSRPFQTNGSHGFTNDLAVPTASGHVVAGGGAGTPMTNIGQADQAGCENPMGLNFAASVSWTNQVTTWCSPGFWKNNGRSLWTAHQGELYSSLSALGIPGFPAPLSKKAPAGDPTLLQVIDNPSIYGGPATNSVSDYLSNLAFGTPIGSGIESCPSPSKINAF